MNERVGPAQGFQRAMVGVGHLTLKLSVRAQGGLEVAKWDGCSWFGLGPAMVAKKSGGLEFGGGVSYLGSVHLMGWGKPRLRQWVCANGWVVCDGGGGGEFK